MIRGGHAEREFAHFLEKAIAEARDVLDIGTSQRFAKELRPYERWFAGKNYVAAGYQPRMVYGTYNCDRHEDIHAISFDDAVFDAVLCIEVLEHVADPRQAAREIMRVLRPGGRVLLTTPFLTQYHGKGASSYAPDHEMYPDFWRFTHQGLQALFADCSELTVRALDGPIEFRLKQMLPERHLAYSGVRKLVDLLDRPRLGKATTRHLLFAVK